MTRDEALKLLEHHKAIAEAHSATCPWCGKDAMVREQFKQATRQEPMTFLGYQAFCIPCQLAFPAENMQSNLSLTFADVTPTDDEWRRAAWDELR